jgi:hypothetical protein
VSLEVCGIAWAYLPVNPEFVESVEDVVDVYGAKPSGIDIVDSECEGDCVLSSKICSRLEVVVVACVQKATRSWRNSSHHQVDPRAEV